MIPNLFTQTTIKTSVTPKPMRQERNPLENFRPMVTKRDAAHAYENGGRFINRAATARHMTYNSYDRVKQLSIQRALN